MGKHNRPLARGARAEKAYPSYIHSFMCTTTGFLATLARWYIDYSWAKKVTKKK
jgi:hypothetical protein